MLLHLRSCCLAWVKLEFATMIKQGDSNIEVIMCFGTKFKLSEDLVQ